MQNEKNVVWKPINGYEGYYEVSNTGLVRSLDRTILTGANYKQHHIKGIIKKQSINRRRSGYCEITLNKKGKQKRCKIHRLVATAFLPNPNNYPQVNHIDGNKQNNTVENLEWCTDKANKEHAWRTGLAECKNKTPIICVQTGEMFPSVVEASRKMHCNKRSIFRVLKGEKTNAKGYTFMRVS